MSAWDHFLLWLFKENGLVMQVDKNFVPGRRKMVFVSTGRCGTRRLYEIFHEFLPASCFEVHHQMPGSRLANVVGNLLFHMGGGAFVREWAYRMVIGSPREDRSLIITDPLTAMVLPESWIRSDSVAVIHIVREDEGFAGSMFRLSRSRRNSFLAHNFIPFWQPFLFPLQNMLDSRIQQVYRRINRKKNRFLYLRCRKNSHYRQIPMTHMFRPRTLENLILDFFGFPLSIPETALSVRSNASSTVPNY